VISLLNALFTQEVKPFDFEYWSNHIEELKERLAELKASLRK
jgi:hypothetical protein